MSHIHFTSISARNIGSFKEFVFPFVPGRHLVIGEIKDSDSADSNGAGKSTVFETLPLNLWKKTMRDKDPTHNGEGNGYTKSEFVSDNALYSVERFFKDDKEDNSVKLFAGGEDISYRKNSGVEEEIQKVVKYSPDLFTSAIVVLQGLPNNFSVLTPTVRKSIVEEMLGFSVWDTIRVNFNSYLREVNMKKSAVDIELQKNKSDMVALNSRVDTIKKINSQQKDDLLSEIKDVKKQYKDVCLNITKLTENLSKLYSNKKSSDMVSELSGLNTSLKILTNRSETLKAIVESEICPECDQNYPVSKIKSASEELSTIEPKSSKMKDLIATLSKTIEKYNKEVQEISKLELSKNSLDYQIRSISNKIENTNQSNNLDEMEVNLENLVGIVNQLTTESNSFGGTFDNIKYVDGLLLPSSKFRTKVLEKYIEYINSIVNSVAPLIFGSIVVEIKVDAKGSGIELDIKKKGKSKSYKSLSGGEKRRLDIIIILAFQRFLMESSGISSNIVVFDEIFDALDKRGTENVLTCIDSLFPDSMCQYIITHNNSIKSLFSSVIKIVKENDVSRIEYSSGE